MYCAVCGYKSKSYIFRQIISNELAKSWQLTRSQRHKQDLKESRFCQFCGNSTRARALALAIIKTFPFGSNCLANWVKKANMAKLKALEINYCAKLHPFLTKISGLVTSQYYNKTFKARLFNLFKGIKHEDITALSFDNNSFI